MYRFITASLCISASAHGVHDGKTTDPYKSLDWERQKRERHVEEERKGHSGGAVVCPWLKALVPKSEKWTMKFEEFVTMLHAKDSEKISERFATDAELSFYNASAHDSTAVGQWVQVKGREAVKEHFASELKNVEQIRGVGLYPDFGRKGGMMELEVFARCPKAGMLFKSTWVIQVSATPEQPAADKFQGMEAVAKTFESIANGHHCDHQLSKAKIWKSPYHKSGGFDAPPRTSGLATNVSAILGQMAASQDCSTFVDMLDDNVEVKLADAFYHKSSEDMLHMTKDVTTFNSKMEFAKSCTEGMEWHKNILPLEFLEVQQAIEAGPSVVLLGHMTQRSKFSPKVMDWAGAVQVTFSSAGKITNMQLYPTEVLHLTDKWSWKYGHGATFSRVQRLTMKTIQIAHAHPYVVGGTAILGLLLTLFAVFKCLSCCCRGKCGKQRVCARELQTPLQTVTTQPIELQ